MEKNVVISDSRANELAEFMDGLNSNCKEKFSIEVHLADLTLKGKTKNIRRYLMYFLVPIHYFLHRNKYNIILAWQQFYALIFCYYCSIFHVKKRNIVIAGNFTYKEKTGKLQKRYRKFMERCVNGGYLDYIHVPSERYANEFCRDFNFPRERMIVAPFGIDDNSNEYLSLPCPQEMVGKTYFLAIGRSNRDYDFLVRAWNGVNAYLVIAADNYNNPDQGKNIIIKSNITADTQYQWITHARGLIIPIKDPAICSGDTVLITSMSMGKILLVTDHSVLAETYIKDKVNGILIEKNRDSLHKEINGILNGEYDYIPEQAQKCYRSKYTRRKLGESIEEYLLRNNVIN